MRADTCIFTGADTNHMPYLRGMLASLEVMNDLALPVFVMNFGFTSDDLAEIGRDYPFAKIVEINAIDADIAKMKQAPGVALIEGIGYVLGTMRKLELANYDFAPYFLWLDADTLVFQPISTWLPEPRPNTIFGNRQSKRELAFQFRDRNPLVREALSQHLQTQHGPDVSQSCINSGVVLADRAYYAELVQWALDRFLIPFGPYLMGDQAVLNVAMALRGEKAPTFPPHVNVSVMSLEEPVELRMESINGREYMLPVIRGGVPAVYHFLVVKPLRNGYAGHPIRTLFEWWTAFKLRAHAVGTDPKTDTN